jgi:hypothetical protein
LLKERASAAPRRQSSVIKKRGREGGEGGKENWLPRARASSQTSKQKAKLKQEHGLVSSRHQHTAGGSRLVHLIACVCLYIQPRLDLFCAEGNENYFPATAEKQGKEFSHIYPPFFIWYSGEWSPIGSTRHCGQQWPIVPAPGEYDGEIGRMTEVLGENLPQYRFVHHKPQMHCPDASPGRRGGKPATNRLSYGTALSLPLPMKTLSTSGHAVA